MGKFNVGDTVMVKHDLSVGVKSDGVSIIESMRRYFGKTAKITSAPPNDHYNLDISGSYISWVEAWLEPVSCGLYDPFKHGQKLVVTNTSGNLYCIGDIVEYGLFDGVYNCKRLSDGTPQRLRPEQLRAFEDDRAQSPRHLCPTMFTFSVTLPSCDSLPRPGIRKEIRDRLLHL